MYELFCRTYQAAFWLGANVLPWRRPKSLMGYESLITLLKDENCKTVMLVTDKGITERGLHKNLLAALEGAGIKISLYDKTPQNPTINNVEEALTQYKYAKCTATVALGGGSAMDCAKGVGARLARPGKSISQLRGQLKVLLPMPLLIAIPTTSGSGSETTVSAIITDSATREKYAINDPMLIPHYVLFLPELTVDLPLFFTATTGMDALCHAIEAYIGHSNTQQTRRDALRAVRLIFKNLYTVYQDGKNLEARANMQKAAYLAGAAFTRAYVGNIHAISHAISGKYGVPHGLANAVIMPHVLRIYGADAHRPLWELARAVGLADTTTPQKVGAERFIDAICELNAKMGIPDKLDGIKKSDMEALAKHAAREANPLYPVPVIFDKGDFIAVLMKLRSEEND